MAEIEPFASFRNSVVLALESTVDSLGYGKIDASRPLETPEESMGDLAFPCFALAKQARKAPPVIAGEIASKITVGGEIAGVEVKGPYVNFRADASKLAKATVESINSRKSEYGNLEKVPGKVILEHTSANPNGPLHVGRARNPIIGDTLVRLFRAAGHNVEAQYYLDDIGKQVAILTWGINNIPPGKIEPAERDKKDHQMVGFYQTANKMMDEDPAVAAGINELIGKCEVVDPKVMQLVEAAYKPVLEGMMTSLGRIGVKMDSFIPESDFLKDGTVEKVIEGLSKSNFCGEEGGAKYLELSSFGIQGKNTKFFFTRSDGTSLYATRDIAYHTWKLKQADRLVNVLGEDHKLEARQIAIALEILGAKTKPESVFYSFVSLPEGKMSTRRGRVVYLDDLIDEATEQAYDAVSQKRPELSEEHRRKIAEVVGLGAIRYNIIRIQPEKPIVFKWEEALNFEGNSAPFIQYSHARACSILGKAGALPLNLDFSGLRLMPAEASLVKTLAKMPSVVRQGAESRTPHVMATYAYEVAEKFNQFYRDCPVLSADEKTKSFRLALVDCSRQVLANALNLLGIEAPVEM
ncbi:MAG: arginine--tRNA ligase [Candidatus Thermoplasmatota archaeon]|nr:arginine--tRNA ligase [Candidatus Thermoplasmatota archaeon]